MDAALGALVGEHTLSPDGSSVLFMRLGILSGRGENVFSNVVIPASFGVQDIIAPHSVAFSPDCTFVAVGGDKLRVFVVGGHETPWEVAVEHAIDGARVTFAPSGVLLAAGRLHGRGTLFTLAPPIFAPIEVGSARVKRPVVFGNVVHVHTRSFMAIDGDFTRLAPRHQESFHKGTLVAPGVRLRGNRLHSGMTRLATLTVKPKVLRSVLANSLHLQPNVARAYVKYMIPGVRWGPEGLVLPTKDGSLFSLQTPLVDSLLSGEELEARRLGVTLVKYRELLHIQDTLAAFGRALDCGHAVALVGRSYDGGPGDGLVLYDALLSAHDELCFELGSLKQAVSDSQSVCLAADHAVRSQLSTLESLAAPMPALVTTLCRDDRLGFRHHHPSACSCVETVRDLLCCTRKGPRPWCDEMIATAAIEACLLTTTVVEVGRRLSHRLQAPLCGRAVRLSPLQVSLLRLCARVNPSISEDFALFHLRARPFALQKGERLSLGLRTLSALKVGECSLDIRANEHVVSPCGRYIGIHNCLYTTSGHQVSRHSGRIAFSSDEKYAFVAKRTKIVVLCLVTQRAVGRIRLPDAQVAAHRSLFALSGGVLYECRPPRFAPVVLCEGGGDLYTIGESLVLGGRAVRGEWGIGGGYGLMGSSLITRCGDTVVSLAEPAHVLKSVLVNSQHLRRDVQSDYLTFIVPQLTWSDRGLALRTANVFGVPNGGLFDLDTEIVRELAVHVSSPPPPPLPREPSVDLSFIIDALLRGLARMSAVLLLFASYVIRGVLWVAGIFKTE